VTANVGIGTSGLRGKVALVADSGRITGKCAHERIRLLSWMGWQQSEAQDKDGAHAVQEATVPPVSEFAPSWTGAFGRDSAEPTARAESPVGEIYRDCRCSPVPRDS
jgi:hypothetical protein